MKILFIEDDESTIQGIKDYCDEKGYLYEQKNFDDGVRYIEEYDPDILVLDLKNEQDEAFAGCGFLDRVWEYRFRPTCVFSGQIVQSAIETEKYKSPLVEFIDKGDEEPVKEFIHKIAPYAECIKEVRNETNKAMRKSFDFFTLAMKDNISDSNIISALCGNRIKSYFDNETIKLDMPIWSQYIYPVLNDAFSTGDIIMNKGSSENTPLQKKFFVILSQSCDIIHRKVPAVLVAKCYNIDRLLIKRRIDDNNYEMRTRDDVISILNSGFCNGLVPLPAIESILPDIAVDLKTLQLITLDNLSQNYSKVASLSSPYKERLIWAYMQTACRPGVPDLDVEEWCNKYFPDDDSSTATDETENVKNGEDIICTA